DTDGDGIRDVCDLDIDNDGVLNPMCILTDTGDVDPIKLAAGIKLFGPDAQVDNCVFDQNADQEDLDRDNIGNICDSDYVAPPAEEIICECYDNPNMNDTDGDGIRDVCDNDIDNDGVLNPICIFDDSGLIDRDLLTPKDDNCIFIVNPDQQNLDANEYGDVCEVTDLYPPIPEDVDGVDDEDGYPEVDDDFPETDTGVYVTPGDTCTFIDYASDFVENDKYMTAITDLLTHEILLSNSAEITYTP
ncbi:thrombospondin type 3 repeat-containing protein, partial [Candidatus Peregrinibacteria bacterium]|nr:thrombospondin type 3 repeat-containing protein [Candidatus Peregrinibacteria bacterium]